MAEKTKQEEEGQEAIDRNRELAILAMNNVLARYLMAQTTMNSIRGTVKETIAELLQMQSAEECEVALALIAPGHGLYDVINSVKKVSDVASLCVESIERANQHIELYIAELERQRDG